MVNLGSWVLITSSGLFKPHFSDLYYFTKLTSDQWVSILPERLIKEGIPLHHHWSFDVYLRNTRASQVALEVKNPSASSRDKRNLGSIPGSRRCPVEGHGNPLQYSCLEKLMDIGALLVTIHRATKSQTWLKWLSTALTAQWNAHIYISLYLYLSTSLHFYWTMILLVGQSTLVNNYTANICSTYIFNLCFN